MPDPGEQRTIELIEDSPFSPSDKYKLLLVHLRARPACTVSITSGVWRQGRDAKKIDEELILDATEVLERVKASYGRADPVKEPALPTAPVKQGERFREVVKFLVARDQTTLAHLQTAISAQDYARMGQLYGHPRTAIEALGVYRGITPLEKLQPGVIMTDRVRFLDFPLSCRHWPAELAKVQEWVDLVKERSPVIYEQLRMTNFCRLSDEQVDGMFGRIIGNRPGRARQAA